MNILFTTSAAPEKSPFSTSEKRPPLGLGSLISIVRNMGHNLFFIDNYLKPSNFIEQGFLQKNNIDFVGIYTNTICYQDSLRMLNKIEALRNKGLWRGKIIVGGPHTSVALETIPKFVEFVVQGEGEAVIIDILNGKFKQRIIKKKIEDLDSIPFQPWDIFSKLPYDFTCPWMDIKPVFVMNTSRGCPFDCTFCSVGSIWGKQHTYFSANRIISEIEYLIKNYEAKGIYFREDNFTLNSKRTIEFCENLIKKNIKISWACETRVDNLSEDLIKLMSESGCKAFYFGIESGSQRILDFLNKKITVEQIENAIKWSKKYNIRTYCSLISAVPGETYKDYLLTKRLMHKLKPYSYSFNIFVGIPDSTLYKYVIKNNLYEHIDDNGLVYPSGFDVKTQFFYGMDSKCLIDYEFEQRTDYDLKLIKELKKVKIKKNIKNYIRDILPQFCNKSFNRGKKHE